MKRNNRVFWLIGIMLAAIASIVLLVAPGSQLNSSSTYNHLPDGYSGWYDFMQKRGIALHRWQKPFKYLPSMTSKTGVATMLQINRTDYSLANFPNKQLEWVEKGNSLVLLGVKQPVTKAKFNTQQDSTWGKVAIGTRRRYDGKSHLVAVTPQTLLGDRFGAIVWCEKYGKGKIIFATTPDLAANAYSDYANYAYLADLVSQGVNQVYVDEYIHGYKDKDQDGTYAETKSSILRYLANTPIFLVTFQVFVLLIVLIRDKNIRFGKMVTLDTEPVDNSQAYIQALALVLQKAESRSFVVELICQNEQMQLQKALGLGQTIVNRETLLQVWTEKTGVGTEELEKVLNLQEKKRSISEEELLSWLSKWQSFREILTSRLWSPRTPNK